MAKRSTKTTATNTDGLKMVYALDALSHHADHMAVTYANHGDGPRVAVYEASDAMYRVWDGYAWQVLYNASARDVAAFVHVDMDSAVWEMRDLPF